MKDQLEKAYNSYFCHIGTGLVIALYCYCNGWIKTETDILAVCCLPFVYEMARLIFTIIKVTVVKDTKEGEKENVK